MEEPQLLTFMRDIAVSEENARREKADSEIAFITEESTVKADSMRDSLRESVRGEADRLLERRQNAIRFQATVKRYELKAQAIKEIWHDAAKAVDEVERSDTYPVILKALVAECFDRVPEDAVFLVNPSDAYTVREVIKDTERSYDVVEDESVHGGILARWPGGKTVLTNTLKNRLARLQAEGDDAISTILFAGDEEQQ